jgi:hypothetical protein
VSKKPPGRSPPEYVSPRAWRTCPFSPAFRIREYTPRGVPQDTTRSLREKVINQKAANIPRILPLSAESRRSQSLCREVLAVVQSFEPSIEEKLYREFESSRRIQTLSRTLQSHPETLLFSQRENRPCLLGFILL